MPSKSLKDETCYDQQTFEAFIDVSSCSFEIPDFVQLQGNYASISEVSQFQTHGFPIENSSGENCFALPLSSAPAILFETLIRPKRSPARYNKARSLKHSEHQVAEKVSHESEFANNTLHLFKATIS
jgi:hypothetical protein